MPSTYPGTIDSYTTKIDLFDDVMAAHVNDLQAAVVAVETELGTNPKNGRASVSALLASLLTGWIEDSVTWTFATGNTATRTGASYAITPKGCLIRYKQGAGYKYGYVVGISGTTITAIGDGFVSGAITDVAYSYMATPPGHPIWFSWIPAWSNLTINSGTPVHTGLFSVAGGALSFVATLNANGGSVTISSGSSYINNLPASVASTSVTNTVISSGLSNGNAIINTLGAFSPTYNPMTSSLSVTGNYKI